LAPVNPFFDSMFAIFRLPVPDPFSVSILLVSLAALATGRAESSLPLRLSLPTDNDRIFSSDPTKFYMYTVRNFEGETSYPWTGGKFGFVRNKKRTAEGIIMTRFHEGIDIRPVRRDSSDRPLDVVRPLAPGRVVYTNPSASRSSYGRYVVVEHPFEDGPLYSLYAHLMTVDAKRGQKVTPSSTLGRLGYSGVGLNRTRAHVHVELNMLLSQRFEKWHDQHFRSPNHHGIHNGINLAGLDLESLLIRSQRGEDLTLSGFIARMIPYFRVAVPNRGELELLERYPFLGKNLHLARGNPAWEIHFSQSGVPLAIVPYAREVSAPQVTWVDYSKTYHGYKTRGRLTGSGSKAGLSSRGKRYIELVTGQF